MNHIEKAKRYYKSALYAAQHLERKRCGEVDALLEAGNREGLKLANEACRQAWQRKDEAYTTWMIAIQNGDDCECNGFTTTCSACRLRAEIDKNYSKMEDDNE